MPYDWSILDSDVEEGSPPQVAKYLTEKEKLAPPPEPSPTSGMNPAELAAAGAGANAEDKLLGLRQLKAKFFGSPEEVEALRQEYEAKRKLDAPLKETTAGKVGELAGEVAISALPGTKAWSTPARAAATSAALSGIEPNADRSALPNALSAVAGGILGGATAKVLNKTANAAAGDYGPNAEAIKLDKNARELYGVNLRPSDLPGTSPFWKYIDRLAPRLPFVGGLYGSSIEKQADEIAKIMNGTVTGPTGRAEQRNLLIEQVKDHAQGLLKQNEDKWNQVYSIAAGTVGTPKARRLNLREFAKSLSTYVDKYGNNSLNSIEDKQLASGLRRVIAAYNSNTPAMTNFENVRRLQKAMGSLGRAMGSEFNKTGRPSVDRVRDTNQLYAAIKQDIDRWGTNPINKPAYTAYKEATDFTKNEVVPFFDVNESAVTPRIVEGKFNHRPEEMYGKLLDPKNRTELDRISERLPKGTSTLLDIARNAKSSMKQLSGREETNFPFSTLAVPAVAMGAVANPNAALLGLLGSGMAEKGFGALERSQPFKRLLFASPEVTPQSLLRAGRGPITAQAAPRMLGGLNALGTQGMAETLNQSLFE